MVGAPEEDPPPSSVVASSSDPPELPEPPLPLDPAPPPEPELPVAAPGSPVEPVPFELPHDTALAAPKSAATAAAKPAHVRTEASMDTSHLRYCRQAGREAIAPL